MKIKGIIDEDFVNYKKPSMFIAFPTCSFKCEKDCGVRCCQNSDLAKQKDIEVDVDSIVERYIANNITSAIVMGGLEPFDSKDIYHLITAFRAATDDDIVIYTGYNETEVLFNIGVLSQYKNIIIKFGRYVPNQEKHFDEVLGVWLASDNQHAIRISKENAQ